jgi:hypothetical protein
MFSEIVYIGAEAGPVDVTRTLRENVMPTKCLVMMALTGAILTFASGADAMTNTIAAGLAKSGDQVDQLQQARLICGPHRCWWRPNYYGFYGPHPGWRWRHPGWRWRRWGW